MELLLSHIPYLLKDIGRFKLIFIDKTFNEYYGLLEQEKSILFMNAVVKKMLFDKLEVLITEQEMENYFKIHATPRELKLFINRFSKKYGLGKADIDEMETVNTYQGVIEGKLLDKDRHAEALSEAKKRNKAYQQLYRRLQIEKIGIEKPNNNFIMFVCISMVKAIRGGKIYQQATDHYYSKTCGDVIVIDNEVMLTDKGVLMTIIADNDIHDIRAEERVQYMMSIARKNCAVEKLYGATLSLTLGDYGRINSCCVLFVSAKPPHTSYSLSVEVMAGKVGYELAQYNLHNLIEEINHGKD